MRHHHYHRVLTRRWAFQISLQQTRTLAWCGMFSMEEFSRGTKDRLVSGIESVEPAKTPFSLQVLVGKFDLGLASLVPRSCARCPPPVQIAWRCFNGNMRVFYVYLSGRERKDRTVLIFPPRIIASQTVQATYVYIASHLYFVV